jgi:aminoglycoside phosphotransferase (APT) family kinase protein
MTLPLLPLTQLHEWLASAFPGRPGWAIAGRESVDSFQQLMERVRLAWPSTGETAEIFVRVYRGYISWWTLATPDLPQRELTALRVAARAGVPVPDVLYASHAGDAARLPRGEAVAVLRAVPGDTGWARPSLALAARVAETLARLHRAPVHGADRAHLPGVSLPEFLPRLASWAEEAGDASLRGAVGTLGEELTAAGEGPVAFIHGDCHLGNLLADGERIAAVIDWEEAALGDPRIDVANAYLGLRRRSPEIVDHFLHRYQEQAGRPLGALRRWSDLARLRDRIVGVWVAHKLARRCPLPSANPEIWIE